MCISYSLFAYTLGWVRQLWQTDASLNTAETQGDHLLQTSEEGLQLRAPLQKGFPSCWQAQGPFQNLQVEGNAWESLWKVQRTYPGVDENSPWEKLVWKTVCLPGLWCLLSVKERVWKARVWSRCVSKCLVLKSLWWEHIYWTQYIYGYLYNHSIF